MAEDTYELIDVNPEQSDEPDYIIFSDRDQQDEIVSYLQKEMDDAVSEREEKSEDWQTWRRMREARPRSKVKNFPFDDSSNVAVPLVSWLANTIYGKLESTFNQLRPFWTVTNLQKASESDKQKAQVLTKYFSILAESPTDLNLREVKKVINYEVATLGTCFVKVPWTETPWQFKRIDANGNIESVQAESHIGPEIIPQPIENVLYREGIQDIQRAPWIAIRTVLTKTELEERGALGAYQFVDDVLDWARELPTEATQDQNTREGVEEVQFDRYDIWEIYLKWDVDGDGLAEDLFLTFHKESGTLLQATFNPIGIRVIEHMIYLLRPHRLSGRGAGQLAQSMQEEVDTIHNMYIDSAKLAGIRMLAVRKQAGIRTNEKIYSGKIWFLDDPRADIQPIQMGEVYPSGFTAENIAVQYAQKNAGIPDIMSGFPDTVAKSGASVGGQMMQLKQGTGIFSSIAESLKDAWGRVGRLILFQLIQHREEVINRETRIGRLTADEVQILDEALAIPIEEIPSRLSLSVQTTDVEKTFEAERQNILTLVQLFNMYIQQTMPLAMQLYNPQNQLPEELQMHFGKIFVGQSKLMYRIFKLFGEENPEEYMPPFERLEKLLDIRDMMLKMMDNTVGGLNDKYKQTRQLADAQLHGGGGSPTAAGGATSTISQRRMENSQQPAPAASGNIPEQNGVF